MSCCGHAEGLQQKSKSVVFPLYCWEGRASLRELLLPFGKLSQGEHELGALLVYAGFYREKIFGVATRTTSQPVSLLCVLFGRAGLTGWFGEAPTLPGESRKGRLAGFCHRAVQWPRRRQIQLLCE